MSLAKYSLFTVTYSLHKGYDSNLENAIKTFNGALIQFNSYLYSENCTNLFNNSFGIPK